MRLLEEAAADPTLGPALQRIEATLQEFGLVASQAERLGGGISGLVLRIRTPDGEIVAKAPLERFRVRDEWIVPTRRAQVEARFARLVHERAGPLVPRLIHADPARDVLLFEAAPRGFLSWKALLLRGDVRPATAARVGKMLRSIHGLGAEPEVARAFEESALFRAQRTEPYFLAAARRAPAAAPELRRISETIEGGNALVHGDASPKNVLVRGDEVLLVDHEVASMGAPEFDVAFALSHLLLKAIRAPNDGVLLLESCRRLLSAYGDRGLTDSPLAAEVLGGLLVARIHGKSPVEYLDAQGQREATRIGCLLLGGSPPSLPEVLDAWPL